MRDVGAGGVLRDHCRESGVVPAGDVLLSGLLLACGARSSPGAATLGCFLPDWQGVTAIGAAPPALRQTAALERLAEVVDQLAGLQSPASVLGRDVLPARIPGYQPRLCQAKVAHFCLTIRCHQHIPRFDILVHQPLLMRISQPPSKLDACIQECAPVLCLSLLDRVFYLQSNPSGCRPRLIQRMYAGSRRSTARSNKKQYLAGKPYLTNYFQEVYQRIFLRHRLEGLSISRNQEVVAEHEEIFKAISRKDVKRAKELLKRHIRSAEKSIFSVFG